MATETAPPGAGISLLPSHILERIVAMAGTGSCGAALSCRPLLSAWRAALARDPRLAAAILLERAAIISNPGPRRAWILTQLFVRKVKMSPAAADPERSAARPKGTKPKQLATEGCLVSPDGALVRALASEQERADYATVCVRELPAEELRLAGTEARSRLSVSLAILRAAVCAGRSQKAAGAALELVLQGESVPPWNLAPGACQALDAYFLGACIAASLAFGRVDSLYPSRPVGHGAAADGGTWQPSRDALVGESFSFRVRAALWLAGLLVRLQLDVVSALRSCVAHYSVDSSSSASSGVPALRVHTAGARAVAASATCVPLPTSVTHSAARPPAYPATTTLATAAAAAAFVNYLAACSLDVCDPASPPCQQRQQTCRAHREASTRTELPSSAPNPTDLRHHHPALCPDCYTMAREAMQLPQTPAARAATHGYCAVIRMLLERMVYGVEEPAATALGRVRQVYGDAKHLALMGLGVFRGTRADILLWLLANGVVAGLVVVGAAVLGLVLLRGWVEVWWVLVELAVTVLWWCVRWAPLQLLGAVRRGLGPILWWV